MSSLPIAIVGIAAHLPSGPAASHNLDHPQFFDFLLNKGQAYGPIPPDRFNIDAYHGSNVAQVRTTRGTFLKDTDMIDHVELGITAKDARSMSLSTRKLIELAFLALLDSGIDYRAQNVGCFASGIIFDVLSLSEPDEYEARGSFGGPPAMIANRISYHLDLTGPSVPVDTACSSSLTATHLAVQAIRAGDCPAAVVAGIQLNHRFVDWVQYSQGGILAPDGTCKPFDAHANGFARGEAGVSIVLKRLDHAIADNDHIYATILGTGINAAGSAAPVNAPVAAAQRDAMRRAWAQAGREPREADYVELHATGTAAGDPTEANWVGDAFQRPDGRELLIGSVKGNIGHTEITAFLASLTKTIHIFRTGIIPPTVNLTTPNPAIGWEKYHLRAPVEPEQHAVSLVGLCSAGIGGANGHAVVAAPPQARVFESAPEFRDPERPVLLFAGGLSPRTAGAVAEQISALVAEGEHSLSRIATTYARRARSMPWRSFAVYTPGQQQQPAWSAPVLAPRVRGSVALVFAGQGPQHLRMGTGLYAAYPVFRASVDALDAVYARATGESLLRSTGLFCGINGASPLRDDGVWPIAVTLPALAILQCALVDLLASIGVQPAAVVGHSAGETAALYASGAGSAAMAVELAIARGRAMSAFEKTEGEGAGMAALACGPADAARLIAAEGASDVDVACFNTADAVTIAGPDGALARVVARAKQAGIMAQRLRTRVPVHSALMERIEAEYMRGVQDVFSRYPAVDAAKVPLFSTVTGQRMHGKERMDVAYFWAGGRQPVRFDAAVQALRTEFPGAAPLEVGPHPVLGAYLTALGAPSPAPGGVLRRPKRGEQVGAATLEVSAFLGALGALAAGGFASVDWVALNGMGGGVGESGSGGAGAGWKVDGLPAYPFAPKRVPWHAENASFYRPTRARKGPLNGAGLRVGAGTHPVLAQHVVKGEPIMPAAGFLEMALEFGAVTLWDVEFRALLSLSAERALPVEVALDGARWAVRTPSRRGIVGGISEEETFDRVHAEGWLEFGTPRGEDEDDLLDLDEVESRCERVDLAHFYEELKTFADYGPAFQRVIDVFQGEDEALVLVRGADDKLDVEGYCFHPAILDCCLHFMVHKSFTLSTDPNVYYLPSRVGRVVVHAPLVDAAFPDYVYAHIVFRSWTPETIVADFLIAATDGTRLCTLTDVEVSRHESAASVGAERRFDVALQPVAVPIASVPSEEERDVVVPGSEVDMTQLHAYLDTLARGVIAKTLENAPRTGADLDRKRYAQFAEATLAASPMTTTKFDAETVREMERKWPEMIEITNRLASVHSKIFETSKAAVEVLYKDDVMTRFYKHYDWASKACAERFRGVLHSLVQAGKQVIRVLEVGSGTGALTRHLVDVMADFPTAVIEFVVSDVSKELLPRMAYPRCRYKAFDISKSAEDQGFEPSSFDVITGFDVLHVVPDMEPSLAQLNRLLVPGGTLLIGDLNGNGFAARSPGAVWFDFVFGSFAEWFSFTDGRKHCALSSDEWRARLDTAGFGNVVTAAFTADPLLFTLEARKIHEARPISTLDNDRILFPYRRGAETELRAIVMKRDASAPLSLWLYASAGFDGDAGAGLARSLGREFALWDVHIVVFEGGASWSADSQREFVSVLSNTRSSEAVLVVDAQGKISVPRVVPSKTPSGLRPFQPASPWVASASGSEVVQVSLPPKSEEFVTVQVLAMSPSENDLRAFVGRVAAADAKDELVVGVTNSPGLSNFVTVHQASIAALPPSFLDGLTAATSVADIAGAAFGVAVGAVACGASVLRSITTAPTTRRRRQGGKALLSRVSPVVGHSLRWLLQSLGYEIVEPKDDTPAGIAALGSKRSFDVVISGSSDRADRQSYEHAVARNGKVFIWNDTRSGLPALLKDDPVAVGEALEIAVERVAAAVGSGSSLPSAGGIKLDEVSLPQAGAPVPSSASLFDPAKAYILVGGIGGLGIRIALWMYEKGARYIVLTSRSGRDTLTRVQDRLALRIVDYLESVPGLTIRLEASDATSQESTADLLRSIPVELGGCMLLSVVLSDRTFAFQDDKDFDKVFASKTGACRIFERCLFPRGGIASLDFFVAFSSVVGLFGNGGQTNYSGANTALDGIVREWDNAFTMVLPAISDSGGLASETREQGGRLGHLTPWGMSAQRICDCLEDALRKLADGPFWQYIPDLDWTLVQKYMGSAPSYSHLVESTAEDGPSGAVESGKSLKDVVLELLDVDESEFSPDVPFTAYGLDSLSAARLSLSLRPHVAVSQLQLLSDISLNDLIARAENATQEQEQQQQPVAASSSNEKAGAANPRIAEIEEMIAKYSRSFKKHVGTQSYAESEVVLVTGTTGAIGTAVLVQLVSMPSVSRVYAFNRASTKGSSTLRERQASSLDARGYDSSILDGGKVVLVEGDQTADDLGISATLYEEIRDSVTSIIHNAWPVNFTSSLASLEPAVRSVRVMIDLALASSRKVPPRFLFLSTIGLFYNRTGTDSSAPEDRIADINQVAGTGYSESKYVGERILEKVAEETSLRPVVVRAGQICGSPNGKWSTSEWFPSLVKSSIHLQCLPEMEGDVSWLPLQTAAEALVEMRNAENHTLHISHPAPVAGSLVSDSLSKALGLPLVPYAEWVSRLVKSADETSPSQSNPALGLLEYFRSLQIGGVPCKEALGLPKLSVAEAVKVSPSLREARSLTAEDVERWLAGWSRGGFIKSY